MNLYYVDIDFSLWTGNRNKFCNPSFSYFSNEIFTVQKSNDKLWQETGPKGNIGPNKSEFCNSHFPVEPNLGL